MRGWLHEPDVDVDVDGDGDGDGDGNGNGNGNGNVEVAGSRGRRSEMFLQVRGSLPGLLVYL